MSLDMDYETQGNAAEGELNLDLFAEVLRGVLAVPAREGLTLLVETQIARSAATEEAEAAERSDARAIESVVT